jgi:hypothetical protein
MRRVRGTNRGVKPPRRAARSSERSKRGHSAFSERAGSQKQSPITQTLLQSGETSPAAMRKALHETMAAHPVLAKGSVDCQSPEEGSRS